MRVCDYIAQQLSDLGVVNVHGLMGGGAAGLNDGFIKNPDINYICYHHEQSAGHAAVAEAKFTRQLAVVNPTTGCGGTNCMTSVLNAWQDSVPVLFISGNVRKRDMSAMINAKQRGLKIRKFGIQEHNIIESVKSITKYARIATQPDDVPVLLAQAVTEAMTERFGPVWLDIPADVQVAEISPALIIKPQPLILNSVPYENNASVINTAKQRIFEAKRPIVVAGAGLGTTIDLFRDFIEFYQIPYVSTYGARDFLPYEHPLNIGAIGVKGSRAGNFAMQMADLLLVLGCSLNVSHIGYDHSQFNPSAYKIVVDVDHNELMKDTTKIDLPIESDLLSFFLAMENQ